MLGWTAPLCVVGHFAANIGSPTVTVTKTAIAAWTPTNTQTEGKTSTLDAVGSTTQLGPSGQNVGFSERWALPR